MSVFGILFWLWFTVSVVMLIRRGIRRRARPKAGAPTSAVADAEPTPEPAAGTDPEARADTEPTPEPTAGTDPEAPADTEPTPEPTAGTDPEAPADTEPTPEPTRSAAAARPLGIADALSGIRLPCDLAPLTIGTADLDPDHVDLVTTDVGPAQVADELGAELTRLGYEVDDLGAGEHLAHRDTTVVRVKVHDRPAVSIGVDGRGFPTAPPDGIVVELTLA